MLQFEMGHGILIEFIVNILRVVLMKQAIELFLVKRDAAGWILRSVYGIYYMVFGGCLSCMRHVMLSAFWELPAVIQACGETGFGQSLHGLALTYPVCQPQCFSWTAVCPAEPYI